MLQRENEGGPVALSLREGGERLIRRLGHTLLQVLCSLVDQEVPHILGDTIFMPQANEGEIVWGPRRPCGQDRRAFRGHYRQPG